MYLIFFDEVKTQPDYPLYHIGGIAIAEENFHLIEEEVNKVASDVFNTVLLTPNTEFHAKDIFHRKKSFKSMTNVPERFEILARLLKILMMPELLLIDVRVNAQKLYNQSHADKLAFMFFCERANQLMRAKKSIGLMIGDRENDRNSERYSIALSQYRVESTDFQYGEHITNLFESVHFTHSHLSRFLQLADIYVWYMQFKKRELSNPNSSYGSFFELLKSQELSLPPSKYKYWPA